MTRPQIIRADTLDLQSQHAPSAKDHTRQPAQTASLVNGRPAPHQEQSIRHAEQDSKAEMLDGPDTDNHPHRDERPDGIDIYDEPEDMRDGIGQNESRNTHYGSGNVSSEDGDLDGEGDDLLDDDLMDKISSSPSIDDEDIDFEFVYALHNFVATVEGQANAAKGDTMVLLDDSNSYWWLVRVVKDGSIGYLPAEHIETPTERLARLNKHRNIDLSATMLGDNSEKSKNPLKKAMRRRNAKTVAFTAPTYIEASDVEWSTDEELDDGDYFNGDDEALVGDGDDRHDSPHEDIVVEPLRPKPLREKGVEEQEHVEETEDDRMNAQKNQTSEEVLESPAELTVSRSRNGTVRNTDSFFKDDTVETKKISLTPNLLRDEVSSSTLSNEVREGRGSFETIDKALGPNDKGKDDKKRKDKKSGMLSGLFKRKDKKSKTADDEIEELEKSVGESSRSSPQPKTSSESLQESRPSKPSGPQRQTSKLQKQPPMSPTKADSQQDITSLSPTNDSDHAASVAKPRTDQSIRRVASQETGDFSDSSRAQSSEEAREPMASSSRARSPSKKAASVAPDDQTLSEATSRLQQNALDQAAWTQRSVTSPPQKFQPKVNIEYHEPGSDSPVNVSPLEAHPSAGLPGLMMDNSSQEERSISPLSPPLSPDADTNATKLRDGTPASTDPASAGTPTWSDASLRSYLDDEHDIRDLFIIVHDKSNVPPAGPDHPISGSLFKDESRRLKEMTGQLDEMLVDWVSRRMQSSIRK